jgi:hypothetical protein
MKLKGVDTDIAFNPGLKSLMDRTNITNIHTATVKVLMHKEGGKAAEVAKEDFRMSIKFLTPMFTRALGVSNEECEEAFRAVIDEEFEEYGTHWEFYVAWGQKREL